jgi:hypothetical protein
MEPCIANVLLSTTNDMQRYTTGTDAAYTVFEILMISGKPARNM